jgi:hypothetical protein
MHCPIHLIPERDTEGPWSFCARARASVIDWFSVPYDRIRETYPDIFGRSLSTGTLVNAVQESHRNLVGVEERIQELLMGAKVLHVDDTGMRLGLTQRR